MNTDQEFSRKSRRVKEAIERTRQTVLAHKIDAKRREKRSERIRVLLCSLSAALFLQGCQKPNAPRASPVVKEPRVIKRKLSSLPCQKHLEVGSVFADQRVEGVFVLRDEEQGCVATSHKSLARTAFRPQSTFKIPHALIGLEIGILSGAEHIWAWDKQARSDPRWQKDLSLQEALRVSCVPCFQQLAREIGPTRMRAYLKRLKYGNQRVDGPIDLFWLNGSLRMSPIDQVEFVHQTLEHTLAIQPRHVDLVWSMLELEPVGRVRMFGKTGLGQQDGRAIGWVVGYLEFGARRWPYAVFTRSLEGQDVDREMARLVTLRLKLARQIVASLEL